MNAFSVKIAPTKLTPKNNQATSVSLIHMDSGLLARSAINGAHADSDLSFTRITRLPERPIQRLQRPFIAFTHIESASGIVLLVCTAIALIAANSPYAEAYAAFWDQELRFAIGDFVLAYPLWYWVNDGLMPIFFFIIGLEIKRELVIAS